MAWKVIGFHNAPNDGPSPRTPRGTMRNSTWDYKAPLGPLPRKVWVKLPGERKPRMPKTKNALAGSDGRTKQEVNNRMAIDYAIWLAKRDGVTLSGPGRAIWAHVLTPAGKIENRVSCVMFNGNVRVDIPNWDWQPAEPVETIVPVDEAFQDLGKRAMATLLDCLIAA